MQNHRDQQFQEADFDNQHQHAELYDDGFEDEGNHRYHHQSKQQQLLQQQQQQQTKKQKLTEEEQKLQDIAKYGENIFYSMRYYDNTFEYRHVYLPKPLLRYFQPDHLMSEREWRSLGVQQSQGWEHYMIHAPEPHVLLFRREKDYQQKHATEKPDAAEVPESEMPDMPEMP